MTRPPVRWAHSDLPAELSRLIASAAPVQQDSAALARMRERLHDSLGPTFESKLSGANPASHVLSWLQRGKWLCAAALATAGLSFVSVQSLQPRASGRPTSLQPSAAGAASLAIAGTSRQPLAAGASVQLASASQQPFASLAALSQAQPVSEAPRALVERAGAAAVGNGAERGQGWRVEHSAKASAGSERRRDAAHADPFAKASAGPGRGRSSARPASASRNSSVKADERAATSGDAAPTGLAAELRGLAEIRSVLDSSPARALSLVETQERQFAQGALGPERELLRIETLIRTGRADEAKRRATRALSASNNPPYRERIEKLFAQPAAPRLAADGVAKGVARE